MGVMIWGVIMLKNFIKFKPKQWINPQWQHIDDSSTKIHLALSRVVLKETVPLHSLL